MISTTSTVLAAAETGSVAEATGVLSLSWLLVALPLAGAAVLLLGGRRTDAFGHLLGTGTVVVAFVIGLLQFIALLGRESDNRAVGDEQPGQREHSGGPGHRAGLGRCEDGRGRRDHRRTPST